MEEALVQQLLANSALTNLVGQRITWSLRDQGSALPAIVLVLVYDPPEYLMDARGGFTETVLQMDCWGRTYGEAKTVARALDAALAGLTDPFRRAFIDAFSDDAFRDDAPVSGGGSTLYRTSLDVRLWTLRTPA